MQIPRLPVIAGMLYAAGALLLSGCFTLAVAFGPPPPPTSSRPSAAFNFAKQAVFKVKVYTVTHENSGGTGFLIEQDDGSKVIVTNRHVCDNPDGSAKFYYLEQGSESHVVKVKARSNDTDLCLIRPTEEILRTRRGFKLADGSERLNPGEHVRVFGHPLLHPLSELQGPYSNQLEEPISMRTFAFDPKHIMKIGRIGFPIYPGNSGSPLLNDAGHVVGVMFAMEGFSQTGLFIPVSELRKFLEQE